MDLSKINKVILCGAGFQTETLLRYLKKQNKEIVCVLVDHFTQKPENCYLIPSKRMGKRNSFSEVDMLIDNYIESVPVKRFDMLTQEELLTVILVMPTEESQIVYRNIPNVDQLNFIYCSDDDLIEINTEIWGANELINALWNTNKYLFSELETLKNSVRRQLKSDRKSVV